MQPVSGRWDAAIRGPHEVVSRVDVVLGGAVQETLTLSGGSIRADETSGSVRALTASLQDWYVGSTPLTPREASDLLAPFGVELHVRAGHTYTEGDQELVPVGVFPITRTSRDSWLSGIQITAPDRSRSVSNIGFPLVVSFPAGTLVTDAIRSLLGPTGYPVHDLTGSRSRVSGVSYDASTDRWKAVRDLAGAIGAEVHVDPAGRFLIRPVPGVASPVWAADIDASSGALLDIGQVMDSEGVYNAVRVASSEVGAPPVAGYAYVADGPLSVSKAGWRTFHYSTPVGIASTEQAMDAAAGMLPRRMAAARILTPRTVVNRALDVGDTIRLSMPDEDPLDVVVSGFTLPLGPADGMQLQVRYPITVARSMILSGGG